MRNAYESWRSGPSIAHRTPPAGFGVRLAARGRHAAGVPQ
ncbi:hypothetical protein B1M_42158, partial [Burkholderia sp. TJI49]